MALLLMQTVRRIRACEGEAAAQLVLEAFVAQEVAAERERWDGVEQYLIAAADGSMSRNNSETLAAELLAQIRGGQPAGGDGG